MALSPPPAPWGGSSVLAAMGGQVGSTASDLHFFHPIFMSNSAESCTKLGVVATCGRGQEGAAEWLCTAAR